MGWAAPAGLAGSRGFAPAAVGIVIASVVCRNLVTRLGRRLSLAGVVATVAGVAVLATIVAHSGTAASTAELTPAMTLIGLGMGATFSTIYDTAIGDIDPAEAGSASGSLSSVQQLANAIGPAVITTIYFGALAGGPAHAMTLSLLTVIALGALSCLAIPLLPSHPQPAGGPPKCDSDASRCCGSTGPRAAGKGRPAPSTTSAGTSPSLATTHAPDGIEDI